MKSQRRFNHTLILLSMVVLLTGVWISAASSHTATRPPLVLAPGSVQPILCADGSTPQNHLHGNRRDVFCRVSTATATATATATVTVEPTATATNTSEPTATATTPTDSQQLGTVNACGEGTHTWHPPVIDGCATGHEHGDAPPAWVMNSGYPAHFNHPANTPGENDIKHTSFKGYTLTDDGINTYFIVHMDTNPNGWASRFHSYQAWAQRASDGLFLGYWDLWFDFGQGNNTGPNLVADCATDTNIRPIIDVNPANCSTRTFESWYSRAGGWGWDAGFNTSAMFAFRGDEDLSDPTDWTRIGTNGTRRIEAAWYAGRGGAPTGTFWATQFGQIVSGPDDPTCDTTRTYGTRTYDVQCSVQFISPQMTTLSFSGNSIQKTYPTTGVLIPN